MNVRSFSSLTWSVEHRLCSLHVLCWCVCLQEMLLRFLEDHFPVETWVKKPPKKAGKVKRGAAAAAVAAAAVEEEEEVEAPQPSYVDSDMESGADSVQEITADEMHNSNNTAGNPFAAAAAAAAAIPAGPPVSIPAAVALREELKAKVATLMLPTSPLDELIDLLGGPARVAEMTGRSARYVRGRGGKIELEARGAKNKNGEEVRASNTACQLPQSCMFLIRPPESFFFSFFFFCSFVYRPRWTSTFLKRICS